MEKDPQEELLSLMSELWEEAKKDSYCDKDGVRYSSDGKVLLSCPIGFSGQYVIQNGVTEICSNAFRRCSKLTSVIIPDSVKEIGSCSFELCTGLDSIKIPNSVTTIDIGTFNGCGLKSVIIPGSVKSIDPSVFENCRELSYVAIREGVSTIGDYAFNGCVKLKKIKLPSSITKIGVDAFANCPNLVYVIVPDDTKSKFAQMGLKSMEDKIVYRKELSFTPDYFPELDLVPISPFLDELSYLFVPVFVPPKLRKLTDEEWFRGWVEGTIGLWLLTFLYVFIFYHYSISVNLVLWFFIVTTLMLSFALICRIVIFKHRNKRNLVEIEKEKIKREKERVKKLEFIKANVDFIEQEVTEGVSRRQIALGSHIIIAKNKKIGMMTFPDGDIVLEPIYDDIYEWEELSHDYTFYLLEKDKQFGLFRKNKIVVPVEYDELEWMPPFILIGKNGKVGLCSSTGTELIPIEYDAMHYDENRRIVKANKGAEVFYFDEFGKPLV